MNDSRPEGPPFQPTARRPVRSGPEPTVSLVVAWADDEESLWSCLEAMVDPLHRHGVEVVVSAPDGAIDTDRMAARFPGMLLETSATDSTKELRRMGMTAATGDVVLVSDHRRPPTASWLEGALQRGDGRSRDGKA